MIAYLDDLALLAAADDIPLLTVTMNDALSKFLTWIKITGLNSQKRKLKGARKRNINTFFCDGRNHNFPPKIY